MPQNLKTERIKKIIGIQGEMMTDIGENKKKHHEYDEYLKSLRRERPGVEKVVKGSSKISLHEGGIHNSTKYQYDKKGNIISKS